MASTHPIRKTVVGRTVAPEIPDKLYFRIGDVAKLCDVAAYVLRFWETEFPQLKPNKGGTGQRLYRRKDVEVALRIKHLLYEQGFTIPGARQLLKDEQRVQGVPETAAVERATTFASVPVSNSPAGLELLRAELLTLQALLAAPVDTEPATASAVPEVRHWPARPARVPRLVEVRTQREAPPVAVVPTVAEAAETEFARRLRLQGDLFGGN